MAKKAKNMAKRAARRLPSHMQDVAFSKRDKKAETAYRARRLGSFGAASEVRKIDPASIEMSA